MASAAARMESPVLLAKADSATNEQDEKVVVENSQESDKGKEELPPVKILAPTTSVTPPASGSTADAPTTALASGTKSQASSKQNDGGTPATDVIDSALLAALRDPRERLGLLKLEQILIDFLEKQPQDLYVDIGGPYNSTVISPTLGYIGQQPQQLQAMAQAQADGSNAGRPQTTFQRCILHRICDRFNMTRENSYTTDAYGCYLIRVRKGPNSKKPPRRLLNVKESEYQIPRPSENTSANNAGSSHPNNQLSANFQKMSIASAGSANPTGAGNGTSGKANRKVGKMKIMKRSGSNVSSGSGGSSNGKAKNTVTAVKTRSTLSEKERKYEEARARIFAQEGESSAENAGESSTSNMGSGSTPAFVPGNYYNNSNRNNNDGYGGYHNSDRHGNYNDYNNNPNRQSSHSSSVGGAATGNPKAPLHNNSTTSLSSMASNNSGKGSNSDSEQQQQSTTTTRSKATYRNRQQEETDPDFRRGAGIQLQPNPYAQAHAPTFAGGGRGSGNVYYHNNMVAANGSNNRVGYGYGQQQQQHYQYHHQQQHYAGLQHHQTYYSNNQVGGRGYSHANMQYQQQRRQQEQHFPALSSSTARK